MISSVAEPPTTILTRIDPLPPLQDFEEEEPMESFDEEADLSLFVLPEGSSPFMKAHLLTDLMQNGICTEISPIAQTVFDKLCTEMLILCNSGDSTISLTLNQVGLEDSPFYGAEVIIEEFSTAPKIFNVTIRAAESAVQSIQMHMAHFLCFVQQGEFSFGIHRIETALLSSHKSQDTDPDSQGNNKQNNDEKEEE